MFRIGPEIAFHCLPFETPLVSNVVQNQIYSLFGFDLNGGFAFHCFPDKSFSLFISSFHRNDSFWYNFVNLIKRRVS